MTNIAIILPNGKSSASAQGEHAKANPIQPIDKKKAYMRSKGVSESGVSGTVIKP